ncbi:AraC family transcriptional regulator, partial [bacterium]
VERGRGTFDLGGLRHAFEPRSLHVRHPGDVHRDVGREGPLVFTVLSFARGHVDAVIGPVRLARVLAAADPRGAAFHRLLDAANANASSNANANASAGTRELALDVLVAEALAALAPLDGPCTHTRAVRRALALLRARAAEPVTLDELAAHAGIDKFRLCRAFRAEVGIPPHAYLTELRVVRAKELLGSGTPPRDVAPLVGFYDQSQLTRHFRKIVGTTPGRWARAR